MNTRALAGALIILALAACTSTPVVTPSPEPTATTGPSLTPSLAPTQPPMPSVTLEPTLPPTPKPTATPTIAPTATPTVAPTATPTATPTAAPTPEAWPVANRIARGGFSEPAAAVDANGAVHIAATAADNEGIWYATDASGRWASQQVVAPWNSDPELTGRVDEPTIAIDPSDGSVWIAFIYWQCWDCAPGWSDGIYVVNNAGGTWSDPVQLTGTDGATYPSVAVRDSRLYLAWAVSGDYFHRYGPVGFGTDTSGAWTVQQIAGAGVFPHLALDVDGHAGVLFGGKAVRYAHQKPNGSFVVERLPGTAGAVGSFPYSLLAVDPVTGVTWAAWTGTSDVQGHSSVFVASRGTDGWSDPASAISGGELIGLGMRDGVVQLTAGKSGLTHASNASGVFVEQVIYARDVFWGVSALALLPTGRPIVVIARDEPSSRSGMWILKGPAL